MAKFKVTGSRAVAGVQPGGTVELEGELVPHLIEVGHITPIATKSPRKSEQTDPKDGEP